MSQLRIELIICFSDGAIAEVQSLIEKNYSTELSIMKAIGVREITNFIEGKVSLDEDKEHNEEKH